MAVGDDTDIAGNAMLRQVSRTPSLAGNVEPEPEYLLASTPPPAGGAGHEPGTGEPGRSRCAAPRGHRLRGAAEPVRDRDVRDRLVRPLGVVGRVAVGDLAELRVSRRLVSPRQGGARARRGGAGGQLGRGRGVPVSQGGEQGPGRAGRAGTSRCPSLPLTAVPMSLNPVPGGHRAGHQRVGARADNGRSAGGARPPPPDDRGARRQPGPSAATGAPSAAVPGQCAGFGLKLVEATAERWRYRHVNGGKAVWARLDLGERLRDG